MRRYSSCLSRIRFFSSRISCHFALFMSSLSLSLNPSFLFSSSLLFFFLIPLLMLFYYFTICYPPSWGIKSTLWDATSNLIATLSVICFQFTNPPGRYHATANVAFLFDISVQAGHANLSGVPILVHIPLSHLVGEIMLLDSP